HIIYDSFYLCARRCRLTPIKQDVSNALEQQKGPPVEAGPGKELGKHPWVARLPGARMPLLAAYCFLFVSASMSIRDQSPSLTVIRTRPRSSMPEWSVGVML